MTISELVPCRPADEARRISQSVCRASSRRQPLRQECRSEKRNNLIG